MNDILKKYMATLKTFWESRSLNQKVIMIGSSITAIIFIVGITYFLTRTEMVPLYTNLPPSETGAIKENLDARGIKSEIADGGSTIKVPSENKEILLVELASEGLPKSGNVAPTFFSDNASFGLTDNEFNEIKISVVESKLAEMIQGIDGIQQAKVMINMPEKGIFVSDSQGEASASILLHTKPGQQFNEKQINSLYNLVSKSVPNLSTDNIVIRNQYLEYFDLNESQYADGYTQQMEIKERIERDIQRQVQNMLGTLMGFDKVVTSVSADIDFTQENREENLVTPVDEENMRGITISAHRINEAYSGNQDIAGGVPQTGDPADAGNTQYLEGLNGDGDYERSEETINNEVNRIRKEIVESPYKIRDLGIQVMVEPPNPEDMDSFPEERREDIRQLLSTIVRTTIDKEVGTDISDQAIQDKVVVSVHPFYGKSDTDSTVTEGLPWWIYVIGGILLLIIGVLVYLMLRSRRADEELEEETESEMTESIFVPEIDEEVVTESSVRKQQLEKMAREKPEDFAKLLRTWLAED